MFCTSYYSNDGNKELGVFFLFFPFRIATVRIGSFSMHISECLLTILKKTLVGFPPYFLFLKWIPIRFKRAIDKVKWYNMKSELQHCYILALIWFKGNASDNNVVFMKLNDLKKISLLEKECSMGNKVKPNSWSESPGLILIQLLRENKNLKI